MSPPDTDQDLTDFLSARDSAARWDAARRLMASRRILTLAEAKPFLDGFAALGRSSIESSGFDRLLAVDLLIRIPSYVRGLRKQAADWLERSLAIAIPGMWMITDSKDLPPEAKPAEVRENIAVALQYASGPWVIPYVAEALAREDRSQRCRVELGRQLTAREPAVGNWFLLLSNQQWGQIPAEDAPLESRLLRLHDIAAALTETLRGGRTSLLLSSADGGRLAILVRNMIRLTRQVRLTSRMSAAAIEVVNLLDEMIATEFTLGTEPATYEPLEILFHWWRPLPYPPELEHELARIVRKLRSAITLRARMGQKSEALATRMAQALGPSRRASEVLTDVAQSEDGLPGDIDDWLRGRVRESSATSRAALTILGGASSADFTSSFAPLLLDCHEAVSASSTGDNINLLRISARVEAMAASLRLSVVGEVGEIVEYRPSVHQTFDGGLPRNPRVRITRPMVVRHRQDGSQDVIERAVVVDAD